MVPTAIPLARRARSHLVLSLVAVLVTAASCTTETIQVPGEYDWNEIGVVLAAGAEGEWDARLAGASTPSSIHVVDGRYFLYYTGADGGRAIDGGPRHRAVGLATSDDGVRFEKYAGSPVMTHLPNGGEEEGANSAAIVRDEDGRFVMFYGAATQQNERLINADARVAYSDDGFTFRDAGVIVLDHRDENVYGHGDELFPIAAYVEGGVWRVFYKPNNGAESGQVAVAWGRGPEHLDRSSKLLSGHPRRPAHLAANVIQIGGGRSLFFIQRGRGMDVSIEVRLAPTSAPEKMSEPLAVYDGSPFSDQMAFFNVVLDEARRSWLLYRTDWKRRIILHAAPVGPPDESPPVPPSSLRFDARNRIAWDAAHDPDTGVGAYEIYSGGTFVGTTTGLSFELDEAARGTVIEVVARNLHGFASSRSRYEEPNAASESGDQR